MKTYNFSRCSDPVLTKNRYTGELLQVPCGCCKGCLLDRRDKLTLLIKAEEEKHKYTLFTTLTYNNEFIPRLQPVENKKGTFYRFYNLCQRLKDIGSYVHRDSHVYHKSKSWLEPMLSKFNIGGFFPYACKLEIQLFLKRLRKLLSQYTDEKIKYYAVSEYGPVTFRPHYHVIFFYDDPETNHKIQECISKAWTYRFRIKQTFTYFTPKRRIKKVKTKVVYKSKPLGRIDCSITKGHASSYVAGYVSCTCVLPRFFTFAKFARPFVLHSTFIGDPIFASEKEKIYEDESFAFVQRSMQSNDKLFAYELRRSLKSRYFPRCTEYARKSELELYTSYTIYNTAVSDYGLKPVRKLAENIYIDLKLNSICNRSTSYFSKLCQQSDYQHFNESHFYNNDELFITRISSELYLSKHFYTFVCDSDISLCYKRLKMIIKFWNNESYKQLLKFYQTQQEYTNDWPTKLCDLPFMYINAIPYISEHYNVHSPYDSYLAETFCDFVTNVLMCKIDINKLTYQNTFIYKNLMLDNEVKFESSIKKKKLNDANKIFLDF